MASKIPKTKFHIPPQRASDIPRTKLIEELNNSLDGRLSLIIAPAGYGKTTLVVEWLHNLQGKTARWTIEDCVWLSISDDENSGVKFIDHLIESINVIFPNFAEDISAVLQSTVSPNMQTITFELVNLFVEAKRKFLLVLDDFHKAENAEIYQIINLLVENIPDNVHFVITSRKQPPINLARWRAQGWLFELNVGDMRFTLDETEIFLGNALGKNLGGKAVHMIDARVEGWPAGLKLAILALKPDQSMENLERILHGQSRDVADYFLEEVLAYQSMQMQEFLYRTSVLSQFNALLCDAVLSSDSISAASMLDELEKSDLFIVPLDYQRQWYRYHHLFEEILASRMQQHLPSSEIRSLHRRAADWYKIQGDIKGAVGHYIKAEDYDNAVDVISSIPVGTLWDHEVGRSILEWRSLISESILEKYPQVMLRVAMTLLIQGKRPELERMMPLLQSDPSLDLENKILEGIFLRSDRKTIDALDLFLSVEERIPEERNIWRYFCQHQIVMCYVTLGKLDQAQATAQEFFEHIRSDHVRSETLLLQVVHLLGNIMLFRGELFQAHKLVSNAIDRLQENNIHHPLVGLLYIVLGTIHFYWNELEMAEEYFTKALTWGERSGIMDILVGARIGLASILLLKRDEKALSFISQAYHSYLSDGDDSFFKLMGEAEEAHALMKLGGIQSAIRWADKSGLSPADMPDPSTHDLYQRWIEIRVEEAHAIVDLKSIQKLLPLIDRLIGQSLKSQHVLNAIEDLISKAIILGLSGNQKGAVAALHQALEKSENSGVVQSFLLWGDTMRKLLETTLAYGKYPTLINRMLLAFDKRDVGISVEALPNARLLEPLTSREQEVLKLIADGQSNKSIEDALLISQNTVRTHVRNLYRKLDVGNRTSAVRRARELGLL